MTNMVSTKVNVTRQGVAALVAAIITIDDDKYAQTKVFNLKNRDVMAIIASRTT